MIHIDPAFLRKYPIAGFILGVALFAGTWLIFAPGFDEARTLLRQKTPATVSVQEAIGLPGVRWITVVGGTWRCSDARRMKTRDMAGTLIHGAVEATEIPIAAEGSDGLIVAHFDGDRSCTQPERQVSGVIGSVEVFGSSATLQRWGTPGRRVVVLDADASPSKALWLLLMMVGVMVGGLLFAGYYLRLIVARREMRHHRPA